MNREGERYRSKTVKTYAEIPFDRIVFRAITQLKVAWKWRKELCCDSIQIESGRLENSRTLLRFFLDSLSLINHEMNESEKKGSKGVFDTKQFSFSTVKFTRDLANWLLTFYSYFLNSRPRKFQPHFHEKSSANRESEQGLIFVIADQAKRRFNESLYCTSEVPSAFLTKFVTRNEVTDWMASSK